MPFHCSIEHEEEMNGKHKKPGPSTVTESQHLIGVNDTNANQVSGPRIVEWPFQ